MCLLYMDLFSRICNLFNLRLKVLTTKLHKWMPMMMLKHCLFSVLFKVYSWSDDIPQNEIINYFFFNTFRIEYGFSTIFSSVSNKVSSRTSRANDVIFCFSWFSSTDVTKTCRLLSANTSLATHSLYSSDSRTTVIKTVIKMSAKGQG